MSRKRLSSKIPNEYLFYILPPEEVKEQIKETVAQLEDISVDSLLEVRLFRFFSEEDKTKIQSAFPIDFLEGINQHTIRLENFNYKDHDLELLVARNNYLDLAHKKIIEAAKDYKSSRTPLPPRQVQDFDKQMKLFREYGYHEVMEYFRPHITINRFLFDSLDIDRFGLIKNQLIGVEFPVTEIYIAKKSKDYSWKNIGTLPLKN